MFLKEQQHQLKSRIIGHLDQWDEKNAVNHPLLHRLYQYTAHPTHELHQVKHAFEAEQIIWKLNPLIQLPFAKLVDQLLIQSGLQEYRWPIAAFVLLLSTGVNMYQSYQHMTKDGAWFDSLGSGFYQVVLEKKHPEMMLGLGFLKAWLIDFSLNQANWPLLYAGLSHIAALPSPEVMANFLTQHTPLPQTVINGVHEIATPVTTAADLIAIGIVGPAMVKVGHEYMGFRDDHPIDLSAIKSGLATLADACAQIPTMDLTAGIPGLWLDSYESVYPPAQDIDDH